MARSTKTVTSAAKHGKLKKISQISSRRKICNEKPIQNATEGGIKLFSNSGDFLADNFHKKNVLTDNEIMNIAETRFAILVQEN